LVVQINFFDFHSAESTQIRDSWATGGWVENKLVNASPEIAGMMKNARFPLFS
jgi:hypothetical protein